jgi:hypothetical protein
MWQSLTARLERWKLNRYHRRVERALALADRGAVNRDGLRLNRASNSLEIEWHARDIHPWDGDLSHERKARLFVEQSLADTETAISRLFLAFPQIDVIDLTVLEPSSKTAIIAGTVHRSAWESNQQLLSVKMRLRELGVRYALTE